MASRRALAVLVVLAVSSTVSAWATSPRSGTGSGLEQVAGVEYADGMHLAVTRIRGRDYAFASTNPLDAPGAIRVFDVTKPSRPKMVASIPCGGNQAFLQISHDGKTLIVGEDSQHSADPCMGANALGFYTIDISDPRKPKPLGWASVERGGHTVSAHPTKPIVYVSYGDVTATPTDPPLFEVWSIADPAKPKHLATVPVSGYHGPHDIAFNADGTRAVASSMTLVQVLDTSDPANPVELEVLQCPGCTHNHEAHFTPDQKHVIVSDETTGGIASPCPLGALYFYDWDPAAAPHMELVGEWQPDDTAVPEGAPTNAGLCTSHVFDVSPDGTKVAAAWHVGGLHVVDVTNPNGVGVGTEGTGPSELGWYVSPGADSWSARFDRTGRYVFVNDANTGFQVYELTS